MDTRKRTVQWVMAESETTRQRGGGGTSGEGRPLCQSGETYIRYPRTGNAGGRDSRQGSPRIPSSRSLDVNVAPVHVPPTEGRSERNMIANPGQAPFGSPDTVVGTTPRR